MKKNGFSLIEMLLVIGLITILAVGSISLWRNNKNRIIFNQTKDDVLLALEKARSRAETGYGINAHGVSCDGSKLTVFEKDCGSSCQNNFDILLPASVNLNPSNFSIIFSRITAQTGADTNITISGTGKTTVISIKKDGTIVEN